MKHSSGAQCQKHWDQREKTSLWLGVFIVRIRKDEHQIIQRISTLSHQVEITNYLQNRFGSNYINISKKIFRLNSKEVKNY